MIQIAPNTRILVAVEPIDFRKGIDGMVALCRQALNRNPFDATLFVFVSRSAQSLRCLTYDGQGFWLCQKRLSAGRFRGWPRASGTGAIQLAPHQLYQLLWNGDPSRAQAAPLWRSVVPADAA
jgi:transposase